MAKQAVIVVHGMGEQRPMGTLRDLVDALADKSDIHVIPDQATGSSELSRVRASNRQTKDRTDFYELYYADLLGGGSFSQLRGWVLGLLFRWPHQVPREVWKIWTFLWFAVLFSLVWLGPLLLDDPIGKIVGVFSYRSGNNSDPSVFQKFLIVISTLLLALKLSLMAKKHVENEKTKPDIRRTLSPKLSFMLPLWVSPIIGYILWTIVPWRAFSWPNDWECEQNASLLSCSLSAVHTFFSLVWVKLIVAGLLWFGIKNFGLAYFGDVARYVDTSHQSVASRGAIRDRAVSLLATLHARRAYKNGVELVDTPEYDRILILAHSLGSVVAYDAMRIYWGQNANSPSRVIGENCQAEFAALLRLAQLNDDEKDMTPNWDTDYSLAQKASFEKFCHKNADWRISDFITMGSPLARADFLMSRDLPRFRKNTIERLFPISPPLLEGDGDFTYTSEKAGGVVPHHAAMFSVTQWLAIFDPVRGWLFRGDFIGGPVRFLFGRGVQELAIKMNRGGFFGSVVTHTNYWDPHVSTQLDFEKTHVDDISLYTKPGGQEVIAALREKIWPTAATKV